MVHSRNGRAQSVDTLRLLGPTGTNKIMAGELSRIARRAGLLRQAEKPVKDGPGALVMPFSTELAAVCAQYHRTCSRVLWDLFESKSKRLEPLYDDLLALASEDTRALFPDGSTLSVTVRGAEHFAAGERQVVGTVKNAVLDGLATQGCRVSVEPTTPDAHLLVRVTPERTTVSLDLGGPMNQRGYRTFGGPAPLRENLAATLVMLARHDPRAEVLYDPMAGTGSIAIEAAALAQGRPIRVGELTAPGSHLGPLSAAFSQRRAPLFADTRACIIANEIDPEQVSLLGDHVRRAGVDDAIEILEGDFRDVTPAQIGELSRARGVTTDGGLILCNPPYGERLDDADLLDMYADFGRYCRTFHGFRAAVYVANPDFERAFGGQARIKKPLSNAQLRAYFLLFDL